MNGNFNILDFIKLAVIKIFANKYGIKLPYPRFK